MASRIAWFIAGGIAASWFIIHKDIRSNNSWGHCIRKPVHPLPTDDARRTSHSSKWQSDTYNWGHEMDRIMTMGRQAGDAMAEMSEATLDSVLCNVEALKAKLAERRAQREAQQKQVLERGRRSPSP